MEQTNIPNLYFGTAMWGWTIPKEKAFQLLDLFYEKGYRKVDSATNYPINKKTEDFRWAENALEEWIKANGIRDLEIVMKVGSLNNMKTPDHILSKSFLLMNLDYYQNMFESNLDCLMIHWDNRNEEAEIEETMEALTVAKERNIRSGLSGIRHPEIYHQLNQKFNLDFEIQFKHNLLKSDFDRYTLFHDKNRFVTYGINAGGLKLASTAYTSDSSLKVRGGLPNDPPEVMQKILALQNQLEKDASLPTLNKFNHFAMIYAYHHPKVKGILIGPSKLHHLEETIDFHHLLQSNVFKDVYVELKDIAQ